MGGGDTPWRPPCLPRGGWPWWGGGGGAAQAWAAGRGRSWGGTATTRAPGSSGGVGRDTREPPPPGQRSERDTRVSHGRPPSPGLGWGGGEGPAHPPRASVSLPGGLWSLHTLAPGTVQTPGWGREVMWPHVGWGGPPGVGPPRHLSMLAHACATCTRLSCASTDLCARPCPCHGVTAPPGPGQALACVLPPRTWISPGTCLHMWKGGQCTHTRL